MIIQDIYAVYGDNLPTSRSDYSAKSVSPVPMLAINKEFKTWKKFVLEYNKYAIEQRNTKASKVTYKAPQPSNAAKVVDDVAE